MRFLIVNEGSRGEEEIKYGGIKELNKLVNSYVNDREMLLLEEDGDVEYVNEFMEMEFGGIVEKCFVEFSLGEEDSVKVFIVGEK